MILISIFFVNSSLTAIFSSKRPDCIKESRECCPQVRLLIKSSFSFLFRVPERVYAYQCSLLCQYYHPYALDHNFGENAYNPPLLYIFVSLHCFIWTTICRTSHFLPLLVGFFLFCLSECFEATSTWISYWWSCLVQIHSAAASTDVEDLEKRLASLRRIWVIECIDYTSAENIMYK